MIKAKWHIWMCILLYCPYPTYQSTSTLSDITITTVSDITITTVSDVTTTTADDIATTTVSNMTDYVSTDEVFTETDVVTTERFRCYVSFMENSSSKCDGMYEPLEQDGGCKQTYLYTSQNCCLSQDWLIGLSAGIGGFVILCLVIALICVCRQLKANEKAIRNRDEALMLQNNAYGNSFDNVLASAAKTTETVKVPDVIVEDNASRHSTNETQKKSEPDKSPEVAVAVVVEDTVAASAPPHENPAPATGAGYEDQFLQYPSLHPSRDNSLLRPKENITTRPEEPALNYDNRNRHSDPRPIDYHHDDPYQRYSQHPSPSPDRYTPREPLPEATGRASGPNDRYGGPYDVDRLIEKERHQANRNKSLREETKPFNYLNATSRDRVSKGMDYAENHDMYGRDGRNAGHANASYLKDEPVNLDPDYKDFTPSLGNIDTATEYKIRRPSVPNSPSNQSGRKY